jgi:hypothetical protein
MSDQPNKTPLTPEQQSLKDDLMSDVYKLVSRITKLEKLLIESLYKIFLDSHLREVDDKFEDYLNEYCQSNNIELVDDKKDDHEL